MPGKKRITGIQKKNPVKEECKSLGKALNKILFPTDKFPCNKAWPYWRAQISYPSSTPWNHFFINCKRCIDTSAPCTKQIRDSKVPSHPDDAPLILLSEVPCYSDTHQVTR